MKEVFDYVYIISICYQALPADIHSYIKGDGKRKKHKQIIRNNIGKTCFMFRSFSWQVQRINAWKFRGIIRLQFGRINVRFAYGRPKTLISMISGFSDVFPRPQTNYLYLSRPQDTSNLSRIFEIPYLNNFICGRKDGHQNIMKIRLIKS